MSYTTEPPQGAVLTLPSAADLSQRNSEAAQLWRKVARLVDVGVHGEMRQTLLIRIEQARTTAVESAAYLAAETDALHPVNRAQLVAVYGLLTNLETIARMQPESPEGAWSQAFATLLRATLDLASATGGQP